MPRARQGTKSRGAQNHQSPTAAQRDPAGSTGQLRARGQRTDLDLEIRRPRPHTRGWGPGNPASHVWTALIVFLFTCTFVYCSIVDNKNLGQARE